MKKYTTLQEQLIEDCKRYKRKGRKNMGLATILNKVKQFPAIGEFFIIVCDKGKPMVWSERSGQLVYAVRVAKDKRLAKTPVGLYTKDKAEEHIKTTVANRKEWFGYNDENRYFLMPVQ